jgi:hypothetical protein
LGRVTINKAWLGLGWLRMVKLPKALSCGCLSAGTACASAPALS